MRTSAESVFNQIEREELADITLTPGNIDSPYCRDKPGVAIDDLYKASQIYALIALYVVKNSGVQIQQKGTFSVAKCPQQFSINEGEQ